MDAKTIHARSNKRRSGFGTVVSSLIMVVAVAMLGSVVLIWANSSLNVERTKIANDFETNSNLLRESFIIEDVWLEGPPGLDNSVNITIRNIGDISMNITSVNVTAIKSDGSPVGSCGAPPYCSVNFVPSNGVIASKETLTVKVDDIDWDKSDSASLDISITTERGSVEEIFWSVL